MLDIKDASGRTIMTLNDLGEMIVKDEKIAKEIKDNMIQSDIDKSVTEK